MLRRWAHSAGTTWFKWDNPVFREDKFGIWAARLLYWFVALEIGAALALLVVAGAWLLAYWLGVVAMVVVVAAAERADDH